MSQNLRTFTKSLYTLDAVAQRVPSNAWDNPSGCVGWSARQVAGHAAWLVKNLGSIAAGDGFIGEVWIDPVVHAWDLADATGIAHGIDDVTAQAALTQIEAMSEGHIGPWEFGSAQHTADPGSVARLIALTGRTPST